MPVGLVGSQKQKEPPYKMRPQQEKKILFLIKLIVGESGENAYLEVYRQCFRGCKSNLSVVKYIC